jgi:predicted O-methyltransferase YrrM
MLYKAKKYLSYYFKADTVHNVHSPFVYEFILDVLATDKEYYAYNPIEHERRILLSNSNMIETTDFGAGSAKMKTKQKSISDIAKHVLSPQHKCRLLFNLVNKYEPDTTIELGTSLGISSMYLAAARQVNQLYTIEADPIIWKLANVLFERNKVKNITSVNGTFEDKLPMILENLDTVDLAYIDGNHTYQGTMSSYRMIKEKCHAHSIMVFDDIYWSSGMTQAWEEIKKDKDVIYTIDVFDYGFVFFDKAIGDKRDFTLIDFKKKPYRIGLWG